MEPGRASPTRFTGYFCCRTWEPVVVHSSAFVAAPFVPWVAVTLWLELLGFAVTVLAVSRG